MTETLTVEPAAKYVGLHPQTLMERARQGKIPLASKPGKKWVFPKEGLDAYLRQHSPCPSIASDKSGTSTYPRRREEFDALLGLPTKKRHRNTTTKSGSGYGDRKS